MVSLKPEEISKLIKEQIRRYDDELEVGETGTVITIGEMCIRDRLYAVARQIIISHESAMENLIGVLAVAIIFIIRKYFSKSFQSAVGDE